MTPVQDATNKRRLNVTISAPINTYFMRIFGIPTINATRTSKAEYVLPVPMGSPRELLRGRLPARRPVDDEDDLGAAGRHRLGRRGERLERDVDQADNADDNNDNRYATSSTNNATQLWGNFALLGTNGIPSSAVIDGLEVRLRAGLTGSNGTTTNCRLSIDTTWNGNVGSPTWSTTQQLTLTTSETQTTFGSQTSTTAWGGHAWIRGDFADNALPGPDHQPPRRRLQPDRGRRHARGAGHVPHRHDDDQHRSRGRRHDRAAGPAARAAELLGRDAEPGRPEHPGRRVHDPLRVTPGYPPNNLDGIDPDAQYLPDAYYNYAIDMPAGSSGGSVWVFDPGFCDATTSAGTGENWTVGGSNGYSSRQPVSAFYDLYNTKNTPYDSTDDGPPIASSGSTSGAFRTRTGPSSRPPGRTRPAGSPTAPT